MEKRVTFSMKEIKRQYIIQKMEDRHMTAKQAAEILGLSIRQIRRLIARYWEQGAPGLAHGNRGRKANNRIKVEERSEIIKFRCSGIYWFRFLALISHKECYLW